MSEEKRSCNDTDVTRFDKMSPEELEEFLRQDALLPDTGEPDTGELIYVMELAAEKRRARDGGVFFDAQEAKRTFEENYLPLAAGGESLLEEEPSEPEAVIRSGKRRRPLRGAVIIAAVIALLLAASAVSSAMGLDIWGRIAGWTRELFGYGETRQTDDALYDLRLLLEKDGLDTGILPTLIPEGYEPVSTEKFSGMQYDKYHCELTDGSDTLVIEYYTSSEACAEVYEKSEGEPTVVTYGGVDFYLVQNRSKYFAVWTKGNTSAVISYTDPGLDAIGIIRSVKGEK